MVLGVVVGLKNGELLMAGVVDEIVEIRWLTGCQGLIVSVAILNCIR